MVSLPRVGNKMASFFPAVLLGLELQSDWMASPTPTSNGRGTCQGTWLLQPVRAEEQVLWRQPEGQPKNVENTVQAWSTAPSPLKALRNPGIRCSLASSFSMYKGGSLVSTTQELPSVIQHWLSQQVTFSEHLLYAWHCTKHFICIISINPCVGHGGRKHRHSCFADEEAKVWRIQLIAQHYTKSQVLLAHDLLTLRTHS